MRLAKDFNKKLQNKNSNQGIVYFLPFASVIFLILAGQPFNLGFLRWVSLIPFLFFAHFCLQHKKALIVSFIAGYIYYGYSLRWILELYPLDWAGLDDGIGSFALIFAKWAIVTFSFALIFPLFCRLIQLLKKSKLPNTLIIPSAWVLLEFASVYFLGILAIGRESALGANWAFVLIGETVARSEFLLQITRLGGIYFAGFFVVLVNVLLYNFFKDIFLEKIKYHSLFYAIILILVANIYGYLTINLSSGNDNTIKATVVQTNYSSPHKVSSEKLRTDWANTVSMIRNELKSDNNTDVYFFPEGSGFLQVVGSPKYTLDSLPFKGDELIIDSYRKELESGRGELVVQYTDAKGRTIGEHGKTLLIPNGEYLPYLSKMILIASGSGNYIDIFNRNRGYERSANDPYSVSYNNVSFGTLPCSSVFSRVQYRDITTNGALVLVNSASQVLFKGNISFLNRIEDRSRIHSASLARPFIQSSNGGFSFITDSHGKVTAKSNTIGNLIINGHIIPETKRTIYYLFGDWILWFAFLIIAVDFTGRIVRRAGKQA